MYYELTDVLPDGNYHRRVFHQPYPKFAEYLVWLNDSDEKGGRGLAGYEFSYKGFVWRRSPTDKKASLIKELHGRQGHRLDELLNGAPVVEAADLVAMRDHLRTLEEFLVNIGADGLVPTAPPWGNATTLPPGPAVEAPASTTESLSLPSSVRRSQPAPALIPEKCFGLTMQRGEYFLRMATINRFIYLFAGAFEAMRASVPIHEVERLAMIVHSAMENRRRSYHTSSHAFDMCEGLNPRQVLATLFHDAVYYQLDGDFPLKTVDLLTPVVRKDHGALILQEIGQDDAALQLCAEMFGLVPGQTLPLFGGMNEFLSAVVAVRMLQPHLPMRELVAIVACIEATIPFRGLDAQGRDMPRALAERVRRQVHKLAKQMPGENIELHVAEILKDAGKVAKRDVAGFAEPNPAKFLSGTWLLIEESNAPLAAGSGVYTLQDYRGALARMEKFLGGLNPENVFHPFDNFLGEAAYAELRAAARKNITFACDYLGAKITSIAIIEALALETGGNGPASMFLGDIHSADGGRPNRLEDFLPSPPKSAPIDYVLLGVLEKGRSQESRYDLTASPLTAFMYRSLGHEGTKHAYVQAKRMFAGELPAHGFLQSLDREMVEAVIDACAMIAISRRQSLQELKAVLPWGTPGPSRRHPFGTH